MSGLAALLAKQREKANGTTQANTAATVDSNVADSVVSGGESAGPVVPAPAKLKFGIKKPSVGTGGGGAIPRYDEPIQPETKATGPTEIQEQKPAQVSPVESEPAELTLDDLMDDETLIPVDDTPRGQYAFPDEIPSTAPIRDLRADMSELMKTFVTQLDSVYEVVHDPELVGQMIRVIMQELQENPDYIKLIADQDVHTMIRALRDSMGLARIKKAEKSTKARGSKKAPATTAVANTLDELFNSEDW